MRSPPPCVRTAPVADVAAAMSRQVLGEDRRRRRWPATAPRRGEARLDAHCPRRVANETFLSAEYGLVVLPNRVTTRRSTCGSAAPAAASRSTGAKRRRSLGTRRGLPGPEPASTAGSTSPRPPRSPPRTSSRRDRWSPITYSSTKGRTSRPSHWQTAARPRRRRTRTTCSSPRTPISASTAPASCSAVRHPDRRPFPAAHPQLPHHGAEPALRADDPRRRPVRGPARRAPRRPATVRPAPARCPRRTRSTR